MIAVASLAFATSAPLAQACVGMGPWTIAALRTAIAALVIALAVGRRGLRDLGALDARSRVRLVASGLTLGAHFGLFTAGLLATSLPAAVALVSLEPLSVVVAFYVAFAAVPKRREALGLIVATAGALVVASGAGEGAHRIVGDVMVLASVALYGAYVAFARALRDALPPWTYAMAVYAVASASLSLGACAFEPMPASGARAWLAVVGLALIPTIVGHTLVQRAARVAPPAMVALVSPGETAGAIAIGAVALSAVPSGREAVGAAIVVVGALVAAGLPGRAGARCAS